MLLLKHILKLVADNKNSTSITKSAILFSELNFVRKWDFEELFSHIVFGSWKTLWMAE